MLEVRRLEDRDIDALNRELPVWSVLEYANRLRAQGRDQMVEVVAWEDGAPVGRGMVLFPEHDGFSASAVREGCVEVRDVFVLPERRRRGVGREIISSLEGAARERGMLRIGLAVGLDDEAAPARALYEELGYRPAHGPFVTSATLAGDDGPIQVGAVLTYLVRDL